MRHAKSTKTFPGRIFHFTETLPADTMKSLINRRTITACTWLYVAAVAAVWLLLRLGGDRWWFSTLILFGPRWFLALPLVPLGLLAALARRRLLVPLTAAA